MNGLVSTKMTIDDTERWCRREARGGRRTLDAGLGGCLALAFSVATIMAASVVPLARAEAPAGRESRPELGGFTLAETETRSVGGGGGGLDEGAQERLAGGEEGRSLGGALREWYVQVIDDSYNMTYGEDEKSIEFQFDMSSLGTDRNYTVRLYDLDCINELNYTEFLEGGEGGIQNTVESDYSQTNGNVRDRLTTKVNLVSNIQFTDLFIIADDKASASITVCVRVDQGLGDPASSDFTGVAYRKINSILTLIAGTVTFQAGPIGVSKNRIVTSSNASALTPDESGSSVSVFNATANVLKVELSFYRKTGDALPVLTLYEPDCSTLLELTSAETLGAPNVAVSSEGLEFVTVTILLYADNLETLESVKDGDKLTICVGADTGPSVGSRRNLQLPSSPSQLRTLPQNQQHRVRQLNEDQCDGSVSMYILIEITNSTVLDLGDDVTYYCGVSAGDDVLIADDFDVDYEIEVCQCVSETNRTCAPGNPTIRQNVPLRLCLNIPSTDVEFAFIQSLTITGDQDNIFTAVEDAAAAIPYLAEVVLQNPARKAHIDVIVPMSFFFSVSNKVTVDGYADLKFWDGSPDRRALLKTRDGSGWNDGGEGGAPRMLQQRKPKDNFRFDVALQPLDRGEDDVYPGEKVHEWEDLPTAVSSSGVHIGKLRSQWWLALFPPALFTGILSLAL